MPAKIEPPSARELHYLYAFEDLDLADIAEKYGCSITTVSKWNNEMGIDKLHRDRELIKFLYWDLGMSVSAAGGVLGCDGATVHKNMMRLGIPRREPNTEKPPNFRTRKGYEMIRHYDGEKHQQFMVHRLMAVAKYGFEAIRGLDVHHKNGIPWDNRFDNIELLSRPEHTRKHQDAIQ